VSWDIAYYQNPSGRLPGVEYLDGLPSKLAVRFSAVLDMVAEAPPPQFSGGGYWEAMHAPLTGYHEVRVNGAGRTHHRLFCVLENGSPTELKRRGLANPAIVVLTGMTKPFRTTFSFQEYQQILDIGEEHKSMYPRRVV